MARINIEECWWSDPRRHRLGQLLGNPMFTESVACLAWRLAQEHWEKQRLIPGYIFVTLFGCYELLQAILACLHETGVIGSTKIRTPLEHISNNPEQTSNVLRNHLNIVEQSYVYVRGSCEYLSWGLKERQKRVLAGQKSAEKRRLLYGTAQPKSNTARTPLEQNSVAPNTLELSSSSSGSGSVSSSISRSKKNIVGIRTDYPQEFELLWNKYGKRGDKKEAFIQYKFLSLNPQELTNLDIAVNNYVNQNPDPQFRKHFGRFLKTDWRESLTGLPNGYARKSIADLLGNSEE